MMNGPTMAMLSMFCVLLHISGLSCAVITEDIQMVSEYKPNKEIVESDEESGLMDTTKHQGEIPHMRFRRQLLTADINPKIGELIRSLDDHDCIGRFFCELGCDTKIFGPIGELINTAMMFINHGNTMASKPYRIGQELGFHGCTMKCDSDMLHKVARYANNQLFIRPKKHASKPKRKMAPALHE